MINIHLYNTVHRHSLFTKMKVVICFALLIVCVSAEWCRDHHDRDCNTTVCGVGFRPDCHHITKSHIDDFVCTCKVTDKDFCIGNDWCAAQNTDKPCDTRRGYAWDCDSGDHGCRCHCDNPHHGCKDDDDDDK